MTDEEQMKWINAELAKYGLLLHWHSNIHYELLGPLEGLLRLEAAEPLVYAFLMKYRTGPINVAEKAS